MDTTRLGMSFGEFYTERSDTHVWIWVWLCFMSGMIALCFGDGTARGSILLSALFAFTILVVYALSCIVIIPLLPLYLLTLVSIAIEANWRIRNEQPYIKPPPAPYVPLVTSSPPPPHSRKSGFGWLIPLSIGLWVGSSWGDDD